MFNLMFESIGLKISYILPLNRFNANKQSIDTTQVCKNADGFLKFSKYHLGNITFTSHPTSFVNHCSMELV